MFYNSAMFYGTIWLICVDVLWPPTLCASLGGFDAMFCYITVFRFVCFLFSKDAIVIIASLFQLPIIWVMKKYKKFCPLKFMCLVVCVCLQWNMSWLDFEPILQFIQKNLTWLWKQELKILSWKISVPVLLGMLA